MAICFFFLDLEAYNEVIQLAAQFPDIFPTSSSQPMQY